MAICIIPEMEGFRRCSEEEWINNVESLNDRAMLELEIGTEYQSIYFVKQEKADE